MNNLEAINKRVSRRTYSKEELSWDKINLITELIQNLNRESKLTIAFLKDGSKCFEGLKSYGMFKNVKSLILLKGDKKLEHLNEKCGYYGEKLVLELTKINLGTCWVGGTYSKNTNLLDVGSNEELVCILVVGNVDEMLTTKEKIIRKGSHFKRKKLSDIGVCDNEMPQWFINAIECVQKAPTALNSMKVKFTLKDDLITVTVPNDYRFDLVDLGICKAHFEMGSGYKIGFGNDVVVNVRKGETI